MRSNGILNSYFSSGIFLLFRLFDWRLFVICLFAWRPFVISSFRLVFFRYLVFSRGVFSLFRLFAWRFFFSSFRHFTWRYGMSKRRNNATQKDEKTPCEITKRRNNARRKDEKYEFIMALFRMAFFRLFVTSLGVMACRKDEITPRKKTKKRYAK